VSTIIRRALLAPWITLVAGVAVAEGIRESSGLAVQIKWPNDIVVAAQGGFPRRRKLAGILAEAATHGTRVEHIVLGYGINLLSTAFPTELANRATSLETELGRPVEAARVLAATLVALNRATEALVRDGAPALLARWLALAPSAIGARIEWDGPDGSPHTGVTAGLASDGALLARAGGAIERIVSGEIRWS
jgi:BirA family biotin operon repressor/biotin-[acetyl-CoA-carboxylase] ligase